jgi:DNA-nicking Smr family endonuclease
MGKKRKYKPRLLGSDDDLFKVFTRKSVMPRLSVPKNTDSPAQDFTALLESYLSRPPEKKKSVSPKPLPYHKRIKRYPPPEKELDLHGFTALGAQLKARSFLTTCKQQGYFTIRIIVGKGTHSDLGPVLPDTIEDLLAQLKAQDIVLGFAWERKKKSRSGSVIVYLRQFSD